MIFTLILLIKLCNRNINKIIKEGIDVIVNKMDIAKTDLEKIIK